MPRAKSSEPTSFRAARQPSGQLPPDPLRSSAPAIHGRLMTARLSLGFDLGFDDLHHRDGLAKLDQSFLGFLGERNGALRQRLEAARMAPADVEGDAESELLIELAPALEDFIGVLFGVEAELGASRQTRVDLAPIFEVKRQFVQRRAVRKYAADAASLDGAALREALEALLSGPLTELSFATAVEHWLADEPAHTDALDLAARYAAWATLSEVGQQTYHHGVLFKVPGKVDPMALVPIVDDPVAGVPAFGLPASHRRRREGFALTDPGTDVVGALDQANYCIWCHNQGKDSCSKGLKEKDGAFRKKRVWRDPCRLPARGKDFRNEPRQGPRLGSWRARNRRRRQPDLCGDRPPHLQ